MKHNRNAARAPQEPRIRIGRRGPRAGATIAVRRARALLIAGDQAGVPGTPTPGAQDALKIIAADLRARFATDVEIEQLCSTPEQLCNPPTKQHVVHAFAKMRSIIRRGDLFVVMFAGHGKEADAEQAAQAWSLTDNEVFTDIELADTLLELPRGVDIVVISNCCYGEGLFRAGDETGESERQRRALPGSPPPPQRALRNSPMVCISGASPDGPIALSKLVDLATDTVAAAAARRSYAELAAAFARQQLVGREFHVDARPRARLDDVVLAVTARLHQRPHT